MAHGVCIEYNSIIIIINLYSSIESGDAEALVFGRRYSGDDDTELCRCVDSL